MKIRPKHRRHPRLRPMGAWICMRAAPWHPSYPTCTAARAFTRSCLSTWKSMALGRTPLPSVRITYVGQLWEYFELSLKPLKRLPARMWALTLPLICRAGLVWYSTVLTAEQLSDGALLDLGCPVHDAATVSYHLHS